MNNLVYLSYGQGPHIDELVFSVLSALHMIGPDHADYRIIVYTDNPRILGDLPVQTELLREKDLGEWAGPFGMNDRRKFFIVRNALQKFGGRIIFCDADTYLLKHPRKLFRRIRPGHTLLHIKEGHLNYCHAGELVNFLEGPHDLRTVTGQSWRLTHNTLMFNSGVIGMDEADISLLDEVIYLADQIYPYVKMRTVEQFAFGACFSQYTKLRESYDIIYHYWPMPRRAVFQEQLRRVLHDPSIVSNEERYHQLLPHRPSQSQKILNRGSETLKDRAHIALWKVAKRTGVLDPLKKIAGRTDLARKHLGLDE
jgi:hypothetical protein